MAEQSVTQEVPAFTRIFLGQESYTGTDYRVYREIFRAYSRR
ncbi:hypothetical protein SLEP1_g41133 [Rubroshorea leprosula]|uniref:Uncharacterized protein n=1 Tax=Rubroshorea leprosula TaxID=152421 RepID=A0AAV5HDW9_9ROSI|nr:hypothetical protein SLEP1_g1481 [Rubroshorea leprosula]GKV32537.1 hypothetical protein SLEP1_g41133 [Rubroshorea leprosula]